MALVGRICLDIRISLLINSFILMFNEVVTLEEKLDAHHHWHPGYKQAEAICEVFKWPIKYS